MRNIQWLFSITVLGVLAVASSARAQRGSEWAANVVVPQARVLSVERPAAVTIAAVDADVDIRNQLATTTLDVRLHNPGNRRLEAQLIVPVPEGAVIRGFALLGAGVEPTAELLPKDEARRIYDSIVAKFRDPALLEFVGCNLVRSSVFPVEANKDQEIRLVYEVLLTADGNRVDYILPRSESLEYDVPWNIKVRVETRKPISTVYSPSHEIRIEQPSETVAAVALAEAAKTAPGAFRLSYLLQQNGVTASLIAYPDPKVGGGYFLLLAGLPPKPIEEGAQQPIKREVTLVFDRSGSMNGEKLEQVRAAAFQVLAGLEDGEAFNLMVYNEVVDAFSEAPVIKSAETMQAARDYLNGVNARGGTNIHDALVEALRQKPIEDMLPIVLFLTDGLPTIGQTSEKAIGDAVAKGNPHNRRVFTFGVGVDVNTPLLNGIASDTRATATFVLPKEDVELKVARLFERLAGPVLAHPELKRDTQRTRDLLPDVLPDLFEGDQLIVLGQYIGERPLSFELAGNYLGEKRRFEFTFDLDKATTRNAFVPRLWASRKIGVLLEAIRKLGGDGRAAPGPPAAADPRMKELVDEVVRLSTEFGILTEYTAFLARDGVDLAEREAVRETAAFNVDIRNEDRSGMMGVNQEANVRQMKEQKFLNAGNNAFMWDMKRAPLSRQSAVSTGGGYAGGILSGRGGHGDARGRANLDADFGVEQVAVQQVNDLAFYRKGNRWVDSRIVDEKRKDSPEKVIEFGSKAFLELVDRLAESNRQGSLALLGDILMEVDGEVVLIKAP